MNKKLLTFVLFLFPTIGFAQPSQSSTLQASYAANAKQRQELMRDFGITEDQARHVQQFSKERSLQINALKKLKLSEQEFRSKRDELTDEYYQKIASILTPEQRAKFNPAAFKASRAKEIKRLNLSRKQEIQMGEMKAEYDTKVAFLSQQEMPRREKKIRKEMLDKEYHAKLKTFLGEHKFISWFNYKNTTLERKYKAKYGFSTAQFNQYKAIENKMAIDILAVKKSAIPVAEKVSKIQDLKAAKVVSMRQILSTEQYEKWFADYSRKSNNNNDKNKSK